MIQGYLMVEGNNLIRLRERRGLTQQELADELGITRQAVSQWESGRAFPSMEKQLALSRLYGVSLEELYGGPPAEEAPEEAAPLPESKGNRRRKIIIAGVLGAYVCFAAGILLMGKFENSPSMAANYLILGTFLYILGWVAYLLFNLIRKIIKK